MEVNGEDWQGIAMEWTGSSIETIAMFDIMVLLCVVLMCIVKIGKSFACVMIDAVVGQFWYLFGNVV